MVFWYDKNGPVAPPVTAAGWNPPPAPASTASTSRTSLADARAATSKKGIGKIDMGKKGKDKMDIGKKGIGKMDIGKKGIDKAAFPNSMSFNQHPSVFDCRYSRISIHVSAF